MRAATLIGPTARIRLLCIVLLGCFGLLAVRAAHLTIVDSRARGVGARQTNTTFRIPAPRGMILDRSGVELAVTLQSPSIYVMPLELDSPANTATQLAEILDLDARALAIELTDRKTFTFVKRWASYEQAERVLALELPGVAILDEPRRAYPAGPLAGQLIGFANIDGLGVRAIEQLEDATLRGDERRVRVERDARGRLFAVDAVEPAKIAGGDVRLTIDAAFQAEAEDALARAIETTGADGGAIVTIEVASGDILSLAESPGIDPNAFRTLRFADTRSRAFLDAVEPGSTMKAFLVAAALDAGVIAVEDRFDTGKGHLRVRGKTIRDHHAYGVLSPIDILTVSSNVGAVLISQRLTPEQHHAALRSFGFGQVTGSGFPQESAGIMRAPALWKPVDHATVAFGQGISVTPVQLAAATTALATGGIWREPRLVAARREAGGAWVPAVAGKTHRAVSEQTAHATVEMLESVVSAVGTARRAALRNLRVAGKTGTAQKFDAALGRYSDKDYLAWFIGIVPADDPQLAIAVVLDAPKGDAHSGGDTAAPLFAEVAASQLAHFGIVTAPEPIRGQSFRTFAARADEKARAPAEEERESAFMLADARPLPARAAQAAPSIGVEGSQETTHFVPDFRGATIDSAKRLAARDSFVLELEGDRRGLAVEQHPSPGTVVMGDRPRVKLRFTWSMEKS